MSAPVLAHFAPYRFAPAFWALAAADRAAAAGRLLAALGGAAPAVHLYQLQPAGGGGDLLAWSALPAADPAAPAAFFAAAAGALAPHRTLVEPGEPLWGLTRPSPYVREASKGAIDPFAADRLPYLVVYPFVKTHDWHRLPVEERRRLMGEHIAVGRRYGAVRQLLLYAYGLADQDFVVVYETPDLALFSELVGELRGTAARTYTARDTPVWTAVHRRPDEAAALWAAGG